MRSEDDTREVVALVSIRLELRDADTLNVDIAESNACSIDSDELRLAPIRRHPLHRAANRSLLSKCVGLRQTESIRIESWYTPWIDRMDEQGQPPHSMESQTVKSIFKNAADPAGGPAVLVDGDLQEHIKSDVAVEQIDACQFYSGNPNVEVVEGILHLYKEDEVISKGSVQGTTGDRVQSLATVCSDMICMLSGKRQARQLDVPSFVNSFPIQLRQMYIDRNSSDELHVPRSASLRRAFHGHYHIHSNSQLGQKRTAPISRSHKVQDERRCR